MIKYGDKVKVIKGFYEGCKGIVVGRSRVYKGIYNCSIEIRKRGLNTSSIETIEVREIEIEKVG